jgi:hypothetical protein
LLGSHGLDLILEYIVTIMKQNTLEEAEKREPALEERAMI